MSDSKTGPMTVQDLIAVWTGAVDKGYSDAFITAGEGQGFEAYTQGFAQHARVSAAVDVSTQACYIMPWSGQSNPPAGGEQFATVTLQFQRTLLLDQPLRLGAGTVFYGEQTNDWGQNGSTPIQTGRLYTLQQDLIFLPGEMGPVTVTAVAAAVGAGFNNPLVGTITVISQPGTQYLNTNASVTATTGAIPPGLPPPSEVVTLISQNTPDMFMPNHVGQYVAFTAGTNNGIIARIVGFIPPNPPLQGSAVVLEDFVGVEAYGAVTGTFQAPEAIQIKNGSVIVGTGYLVAVHAGNAGHTKFGFVSTTGNVAVGNTLNGVLSGASVTVSLVNKNPAFAAASGTESWRILDWVVDWGLTVTNTTQPSGGQLGMLDAIGYDRNLPRLPTEQPSNATTDNAYRKRVWQIADTVTPNAVKRTLYRVLGSVPWCFREVGTNLLPGFFYDGNNLNAAANNGAFTPDAYDYDVLVLTGTGGGFSAWPPGGTTPVVGNTYTPGFQEKVTWFDQFGNIKATGYFGSLTSGATVFTMIRKTGMGSLTDPIVVGSGDFVLGAASGGIFLVTGFTALTTPAAMRWHVYLDYTDFRAMFMVGVPRVNYGEFGFAWGAHPDVAQFPTNAYDIITPYLNFYDGFPAGSKAFYQGIYNAILPIKAGGVSFYLYREDGTCT